MSSRRIQVSVECSNPSTGEMAITVEDPGNADPELAYQDLLLHPAVCSALHKLLGSYVTPGIGSTQSVTLNAPAGSAGGGS